MPNQLTVTAKAGPNIQNTAVVLTGLTSIFYDFARQVVQVNAGTPQVKEYDLTGVTTATITISAPNYTLVLS